MGKILKKLELMVEHDESCDQMRGVGGCNCEMKMFGKRLSVEAVQTELPSSPAVEKDGRILKKLELMVEHDL